MIVRNSHTDRDISGISYKLGLLNIFFIFSFTACQPQQPLPLKVIGEINLPSQLAEISGMAIYKSSVYAINDSGNGAVIYQLGLDDFSIKNRYRIRDLTNHDWEELSVYDDILFIGDFGNNRGNRRDLAIYEIPIGDLGKEKPRLTVREFEYRNQDKFNNLPHTHRWDCEAMVITADRILLISKDWPGSRSLLYSISRDSLSSSLLPLQELNLGFLVTGACYGPEDSVVYFCGHNNEETFIALAELNDNFRIKGRIRKFVIPELKNRQVESVFVLNGIIYLASESTLIKQKIYKVEIPVEYEK